MIFDCSLGFYQAFLLSTEPLLGRPEFYIIDGKLSFLQFFGSVSDGTLYFNSLDFEIILEKPQFFSNFVFSKNPPVSDLFVSYNSASGLKYCDSPNISFLHNFKFEFSHYAKSLLLRDSCSLSLHFFVRNPYSNILEIEIDIFQQCNTTLRILESKVCVIRCPAPSDVSYCCSKLDFTNLENLLVSNP